MSNSLQPQHVDVPSVQQSDLFAQIIDCHYACYYALDCKCILLALIDAPMILSPVLANILQDKLDKLLPGLSTLGGIDPAHKIELKPRTRLKNHAVYMDRENVDEMPSRTTSTQEGEDHEDIKLLVKIIKVMFEIKVEVFSNSDLSSTRTLRPLCLQIDAQDVYGVRF